MASGWNGRSVVEVIGITWRGESSLAEARRTRGEALGRTIGAREHGPAGGGMTHAVEVADWPTLGVWSQRTPVSPKRSWATSSYRLTAYTSLTPGTLESSDSYRPTPR